MQKSVKILLLLLLVIFSVTTYSVAEENKLPDLIPYRKGDKWGFCDKNKKIVVPCKYDLAHFFKEGLACVQVKGKYGFVNKEGKEVIPLKYDSAWYFIEGFASVQLNGKWGIIDTNGTEYWED